MFNPCCFRSNVETYFIISQARKHLWWQTFTNIVLIGFSLFTIFKIPKPMGVNEVMQNPYIQQYNCAKKSPKLLKMTKGEKYTNSL